jgi:hypothetical protein
MSSIRRAVREGWTLVKVGHDVPDNFSAHLISRTRHRNLLDWAMKNRTNQVKATLKATATYHGPRFESMFAFENEADASMFSLKWK